MISVSPIPTPKSKPSTNVAFVIANEVLEPSTVVAATLAEVSLSAVLASSISVSQAAATP